MTTTSEPLPSGPDCSTLVIAMTPSDMLKGTGKTEKLSITVLALCIAVLVALLLLRPF